MGVQIVGGIRQFGSKMRSATSLTANPRDPSDELNPFLGSIDFLFNASCFVRSQSVVGTTAIGR